MQFSIEGANIKMLSGLLLLLAKASLCCISSKNVIASRNVIASNNIAVTNSGSVSVKSVNMDGRSIIVTSNGLTTSTAGPTSHRIQGSIGSFRSNGNGMTLMSKCLAYESRTKCL